MTGALASHEIGRETAQLVVNKRHELVERRLVPAAPLRQEARDLSRARHKGNRISRDGSRACHISSFKTSSNLLGP